MKILKIGLVIANLSIIGMERPPTPQLDGSEHEYRTVSMPAVDGINALTQAVEVMDINPEQKRRGLGIKKTIDQKKQPVKRRGIQCPKCPLVFATITELQKHSFHAYMLYMVYSRKKAASLEDMIDAMTLDN